MERGEIDLGAREAVERGAGARETTFPREYIKTKTTDAATNEKTRHDIHITRKRKGERKRKQKTKQKNHEKALERIERNPANTPKLYIE